MNRIEHKHLSFLLRKILSYNPIQKFIGSNKWWRDSMITTFLKFLVLSRENLALSAIPMSVEQSRRRTRKTLDYTRDDYIEPKKHIFVGAAERWVALNLTTSGKHYVQILT